MDRAGSADLTVCFCSALERLLIDVVFESEIINALPHPTILLREHIGINIAKHRNASALAIGWVLVLRNSLLDAYRNATFSRLDFECVHVVGASDLK